MTEPYTGLAAVLSVGALIIGLAWLFLPFLVLSKMGEILKVQKELLKEARTANGRAARNDALLVSIQENTGELKREYQTND